MRILLPLCAVALLTARAGAQAPLTSITGDQVEVILHDAGTWALASNGSLVAGTLRACARLFGYPQGLSDVALAHAQSAPVGDLTPPEPEGILAIAAPMQRRVPTCVKDLAVRSSLLARGLYAALDSTLSPGATAVEFRLVRDGVAVQASRARAIPLMAFTPRAARVQPNELISQTYSISDLLPTASGEPLYVFEVRGVDGSLAQLPVGTKRLREFWREAEQRRRTSVRTALSDEGRGITLPAPRSKALAPAFTAAANGQLRTAYDRLADASAASRSSERHALRSLLALEAGDMTSARIAMLEARRTDACFFLPEAAHPDASSLNAVHWRERHCRPTSLSRSFLHALVRPDRGHPVRPHARWLGLGIVAAVAVTTSRAFEAAERANDEYREYLGFDPGGSDGSGILTARFNRANDSARLSRQWAASAVGLWLGNAGWSLWTEYRGRRRAAEAGHP